MEDELRIVRQKEKKAAHNGDYLLAHQYQQESLGISMAMCNNVVSSVRNSAMKSELIALRAIEAASHTSKRMKLEFQLNH